MPIVVGFVPTPEGRAAVRRAADEAVVRRTRLIVVDSHEGGRSYDGEQEVRLQDALAQARAFLESKGVEHEMRTFVRGNEPAEDLIQVAQEADADFIVIGLRRRSAVGKLVLGSNAQEILRTADCPVLAVKANEED